MSIMLSSSCRFGPISVQWISMGMGIIRESTGNENLVMEDFNNNQGRVLFVTARDWKCRRVGQNFRSCGFHKDQCPNNRPWGRRVLSSLILTTSLGADSLSRGLNWWKIRADWSVGGGIEGGEKLLGYYIDTSVIKRKSGMRLDLFYSISHYELQRSRYGIKWSGEAHMCRQRLILSGCGKPT